MADLHQPDAAPDDLHHEESDVNINAVLTFGAGLFAVFVVVSLLVFVMFRYLDGRETRSEQVEYPLAVSQSGRVPPEPRLQTNPREDLREMRAKEDDLLHSYGWVNKNAGVVRIPIDDAIRLTLERGLPARQPVKP